MSVLEKISVIIAFSLWLSSLAMIANEEGYFESFFYSKNNQENAPTLLKPGKTLLGIYQTTRSGATERVGESQTTTMKLENNSTIMTTRTQADLKLVSYIPINFDSSMQIIFDPDGNMAQFSHSLTTSSTNNLNINIEGMRQDNRFHFTVTNNNNIIYQDSFPITHNLSVGSGLLPTGQFKDPEKYKSWPINYINPITKKNEKGKATVSGKKDFSIGDKVYSTYKINITFAENAYLAPTAYITREGELIELRGIAGYIFRKEPESGNKNK